MPELYNKHFAGKESERVQIDEIKISRSNQENMKTEKNNGEKSMTAKAEEDSWGAQGNDARKKELEIIDAGLARSTAECEDRRARLLAEGREKVNQERRLAAEEQRKTNKEKRIEKNIREKEQKDRLRAEKKEARKRELEIIDARLARSTAEWEERKARLAAEEKQARELKRTEEKKYREMNKSISHQHASNGSTEESTVEAMTRAIMHQATDLRLAASKAERVKSNTEINERLLSDQQKRNTAIALTRDAERARKKQQTKARAAEQYSINVATRQGEAQARTDIVNPEHPGFGDVSRSSMLKDEHAEAVLASAEFPPVLSAKHLRECADSYHKMINDLSCEYPCGDCGRLMNKIYSIPESDPVIIKYRSVIDACAMPKASISQSPIPSTVSKSATYLITHDQLTLKLKDCPSCTTHQGPESTH